MLCSAAFLPPVPISLHRPNSFQTPRRPYQTFTPASTRVHVRSCVESPTPTSEESAVSNTSALGEDAPSSKAALSIESARESVAADVAATIGWISVAAATAAAVAWTRGSEHALEFITAYIVEYSLSVDNLFVFLLIFGYFRVNRKAQLRVLTWGIIGAMSMRAGFIFIGEALTQRFKVVTLAFAGLLLYSAVKLLLESGGDEEEDLEQNRIIRFSKSLFRSTDRYEGDKFFTVVNGERIATPLLVVLLCIELSDIVFAMDSVPAVLGVSDDTLVIYLSNILAVMGLRNLYFVLSDAIGDLRFLRQALAVVLGFVGGKMLAGAAGYQIDVLPSLGVVVGVLGAGIGFSVAFPEEKAKNGK